MNELRFEVASPKITLSKYGKHEVLTFKDDYGKNEIAFDMAAGTTVDIVSNILHLFTIQQLDILASKLVYESLNDEQIVGFIKAIKNSQTEHEKDKQEFEINYPLGLPTRVLVGV